MKTYYDVLGVTPDATGEDIRNAYLLRSKVLHPDRFDPQRQRTEWELANELLKELNHAYSVLRDPALRAKYRPSASGAPRKEQRRSQKPAAVQPARSAPPANQPTPPVSSFQFDKRLWLGLLIVGIWLLGVLNNLRTKAPEPTVSASIPNFVRSSPAWEGFTSSASRPSQAEGPTDSTRVSQPDAAVAVQTSGGSPKESPALSPTPAPDDSQQRAKRLSALLREAPMPSPTAPVQ